MEEKKKPNTTLELNIISCHDLKSTFNFFRKLNTYVIVSVIQDDNRSNPNKHHTPSHSQKTPTDRNGDRNPQWNHSMNFNFQTIPDEKVVSLEFNVMCEHSVIRDRKIGVARLPLGDLQFDKILRYLVLSVKNSDGKERGKLKMSWKFSGERAKIQEGKVVQMKSYSSMKSNAVGAMQKIEWPILPSVSFTELEEGKISRHDGSCNGMILCPLDMKSLSSNTSFNEMRKNYKKI